MRLDALELAVHDGKHLAIVRAEEDDVVGGAARRGLALLDALDIEAFARRLVHRVQPVDDLGAGLDDGVEEGGAVRVRVALRTLRAYFALKPSTIFNHQARGNEPSISKQPLERAAESQARLFRAITKTSPEEIRDVQHDANPDGPTPRRCEEAMHLSQRHGGMGWSHPRLNSAGASSGRVAAHADRARRRADHASL